MDLQNIIIASSNKGKIAEFRKYFSEYNIKIYSQSDFDISPVEETGLSFVENAILKARHCAKIAQMPALADDSGICVNALGGKPGIYSARYSFTGNSLDNINKLLLKTKNIQDKGAYFYCAIALCVSHDDPTPIISTGRWDGKVLDNMEGEKGFGYDPIFYCNEYKCSAANIDIDIKNKISHRAKALNGILRYF